MLDTEIKYGKIKDELHAFLQTNSFTKTFILVDENTKQFCLQELPSFHHILIEIKSGETNKNLDTCQTIWAQLLHHQADRNSLLINLGGGVISDMGGFCAATYKRGIQFINIPTTLLAMVDATVGGKTGIDFQFQKNMIGLFSLATKVFVDPVFLKTLDNRQLKSGRAEMLKHGLIADENHFKDVLEKEMPNLDLIRKSIQIKQQIVSADPYEKNIRKSLNFGHTLGHALESYFLENGKDILHGEAIAQGMIWALQLSVKYTNLDATIATKYSKAIEALYGKSQVSNVTLKSIIYTTKNDKKNTSNNINFCLLTAIGTCVIDQSLNEDEIYATISNF